MVVSLIVWALHAVASCGSAQVIAQLSGNGPTSVTGTARDPAGNLYIAGATAANNLPANGLQTKPGGSNLILSSAGQQQLLFPPTANEIRCLVASPQEPGTLLLFEGGLLHRSHDAGSSWTTVATSLSADSDCAAVLHTGDGTLIQLRTDGWLFASDNGGTLWTRHRLLSFPSFAGDNVRLSVDPFRPGHLLCGAGGEYQSEDGGRTLTRAETGFRQMIFDPLREGVMYAVRAPDRSALLRSEDSGKTWVPVETQPENMQLAQLSISVAGTRAALLSTAAAKAQRSFDGGKTWEPLQLPASFSKITSSLRYGALFGFASHEIYRSDNQGTTWTPVLKGRTPENLTAMESGSASILYGEAAPDAYVAKFNPQGELQWLTYLGGSDREAVGAIATDSAGHVYIGGNTCSESFPRTTGQPYAVGSVSSCPPFITRISPDGQRIEYSFLFGNSPATLLGLGVDSQGNATATGKTAAGHPATPGAYREQPVPNSDSIPVNGFAFKLDTTGSRILYSTFLPDTMGRQIDVFDVAFD